jgi:hypothetical protein
VAKALVLVSDQHPAWTRHDLLKQLALVMPPETRQMSAEEALELLLGLADEALSSRTGQVVCLEARWQASGQDANLDIAAAQVGDHPLGEDPRARRRARHRTRGRGWRLTHHGVSIYANWS